MKSLEIVNDGLNYIEICDVSKAPITRIDLETIKQDLEVLEILRKHLFFIPTGKNKEQLYIATDITNYLSEKDKEKFNKVKQWLEENK